MVHKLIVGLGNIGKEYIDTRHNVGFMVVDAFAKHINVNFHEDRYVLCSNFKVEDNSIHLLKPTTYMNNSGLAVKYWKNFYKVDIKDILVIVDDVHLENGVFRYRQTGSSGGHNGLKSIEQHLGTNEYQRLRVGVGNDYERGQQAQYVLSRLSQEELNVLSNMNETFYNIIYCFSVSLELLQKYMSTNVNQNE